MLFLLQLLVLFTICSCSFFSSYSSYCCLPSSCFYCSCISVFLIVSVSPFVLQFLSVLINLILNFVSRCCRGAFSSRFRVRLWLGIRVHHAYNFRHSGSSPFAGFTKEWTQPLQTEQAEDGIVWWLVHFEDIVVPFFITTIERFYIIFFTILFLIWEIVLSNFHVHCWWK